MVSKIYLILIMIMDVISMEMLMGFAQRGRTAGKEQTHKPALFTHIPNQAFANTLIFLQGAHEKLWFPRHLEKTASTSHESEGLI